MATELLSDLASALSQRFSPVLAQQNNNVTVLLSTLPTVAWFGKNVAFDAEMAGGATGVGSRAEGANFSSGDFSFDADVPGILSWPEYAGALSVTDKDVNAAMSSEGTATELMNLLSHRVSRKGQWLATSMNVDAWVGTGTDGSSNPNIVGLTGGAFLSTGSYASLDRGTYPLWAGNVLANGGIARPLTADLMNQAIQNIYIKTSSLPDVIVCDPFTFRQYKKLFTPIQRVMGITDKFDAGVPQLSFEGIPIKQDKDAPNGTMAFINTQVTKKVYLPYKSDSVADVWKYAMMLSTGENGLDVSVDNALPLIVVPLARNGLAQQWAVGCHIQVVCTRPAANALIQDITTA